MTSLEPSSSYGKRKRDMADEGEDSQLPYGEILEDDNGGFMDDVDEPHTFGYQALPVANLPKSYDGVPQNGSEYLFTVRREERRLPLVTRAPNPYNETHGVIFKPEPVHTLSECPIPSDEWRSCFEQRLKNMRQNIRQRTISTSPNQLNINLPELVDRDRWWAFLRGDPEWEAVPGFRHHTKGSRKGKTAKYDEPLSDREEKMRGWVIYEESLSWDEPEEDCIAVQGKESDTKKDDTLGEVFNKSLAKDAFSPQSNVAEGFDHPMREPTPRLLCHLDQKTILQLLKFFVSWIEAHFDCSLISGPPSFSNIPQVKAKSRYDFTPTHSRWIFALLALLDGHLSSDEISVLRSLAREVVKLIKEERTQRDQNTTYMGEIGCWMIVAAVSGIWGQRDLWTDAVDILR